jgi:hypothetical protein
MKLLAVMLALVTTFVAAPIQAGNVPHTVAGFTLGQNIASLGDRLQMDTVLPLRYQEYLQEVEIAPLPGFKGGLIAYGDCAHPGNIVRIKLKYADASRAFYDALLARVERRFGKPTSYEGDPFHIVIDWKWSFVDPEGRRITLHLSHNNQDEEEKFGNSLKLTQLSALDAERQCYLDRHPPEKTAPGDRLPPLRSMTQKDWQRLLPQ